MARPTAPEKEPGRLKQMWQVFQMTRRYDGTIVLYLLLAFLAPTGAGIVLAILLGGGNPVPMILYIVMGTLAGVLLTLIVLGRRAEKAAFSQIEGQPGAVGAVLKSSLRRSWTGNEIPINFNKTQDAVYRAVGKGGVVLFGEGPRSRTQPMLDKERANVRRILPEVPVHLIFVGPDPDSTPLHKIVGRLAKYKRVLTKNEIMQVSNRLQSLGKNGLPIPKGIDPQRVRAPRPR
jgi:uncharacterized membrane protein YeaQ/YmgE (transglycosylase-associated protein family)